MSLPTDFRKHIIIKGAAMHNLKSVDVAFQKNAFNVVCGVSGSGKSSLVFDTLYAEGQRRYVESLSAYVRQFMGKMNKPEVTFIKGIAPAIAIEQKVNTRNPRSTVATSTEIYDYLKLLFAKVGRTFSPISGEEVKKDSPESVLVLLNQYPNETILYICAPFNAEVKPAQELSLLQQKGYSRVFWKGEMHKIDDLLELNAKTFSKAKATDFKLIIDRVIIDQTDDEVLSRITESAQTAFTEGAGTCMVLAEVDGKTTAHEYSDRFEKDGITFEVPTTNLFSFNNSFGACKKCEGFGQVIGIDEHLVIPDQTRSVYDGAVAPWRSDAYSEWKMDFVKNAVKFDFPVHREYLDLSTEEKELLWNGNKELAGVNEFFKKLEGELYKIQSRVLLSKYRGKTKCPDCKGSRLRKDAGYVKLVDAKSNKKWSVMDLVTLQTEKALEVLSGITLNAQDSIIAERPLKEILSRLRFLCDVGLGYLNLNRLSNTLSGGESQRINLATSLGSSLVGSMYILDEPSIGLHSKDTENLIAVLKQLKDLGNTLIVVEHDEDVLKAADTLTEIGPLAGLHGGELVFQGDYQEMLNNVDSLTGRYLSGKENIPLPAMRRKWTDCIKLNGVREHNLKNLNVRFPIGVLTCITGVSGSGKTTLVKTVLHGALQNHFGLYPVQNQPAFDALEGALKQLGGVELIDQNPIGKSSRSNPVTYLKAYDAIRELYASQHLAKTKGLRAGHFSFNIDGGRCDNCQGEGEVIIEMQFMADLRLPCEVCNGSRFKEEILEVEYKGKNIHHVLGMSVDEAIAFFQDQPNILQRLKPLADVGLGYVALGQSSNTLSGGEAQRIKLASFLVKGNSDQKLLFIFDEPTTGLHFNDIKKLIKSFDALIEKGHTVLVIEHNLDVVKCADWVIDLGPVGGDQGGYLVFEGLPEDLIKVKESATASYLAPKLAAQPQRAEASV